MTATRLRKARALGLRGKGGWEGLCVQRLETDKNRRHPGELVFFPFLSYVLIILRSRPISVTIIRLIFVPMRLRAIVMLVP